jgi:hypothetical protein
VDEATKCTKSFFSKKKSDQASKIKPYLTELKDRYQITVQTICLDNSGQNKSLEQACIKNSLGILLEYTAPGTPQQYGIVERAHLLKIPLNATLQLCAVGSRHSGPGFPRSWWNFRFVIEFFMITGLACWLKWWHLVTPIPTKAWFL